MRDHPNVDEIHAVENVVAGARALTPDLRRELEALVRIPSVSVPGRIDQLMIPYTLILTVAWLLCFIAWYLIGIPVGPGWPIR